MAIPRATAYSPKTKTDGITLIGADVIVIDNAEGEGIAAFDDATAAAPGQAVLCTSADFNSEDPADYESVTYISRDVASNELRGVTRGYEGTAREWPDATAIAPYTTAESFNELRTLALANEGDIVTNATGITTVQGNLTTHEAEVFGDDVHGLLNKVIDTSDSNATGRWVKYSDGTMICYGTYTGSHAITTAFGELFRSDEITISWPQTFDAAPITSFTAHGTITFWIANWTASTTTGQGVMLIRPVSNAATTRAIHFMAIGRWS